MNGSSRANTYTFLPVTFRQTLERTDDVVFVASMALNLILIVILCTERNAALKAYSRVLLQCCGCDILYSLAMVTAKFKCEFYDGQLVMLVDGIYADMSIVWHFVGLAIYVFALYFSMFIMPVVFYFRYMLVVKNKLLSSGQLWQIFFAIAVFSALPALCIVTANLRMPNNRERLCAEVFAHPMWTYGGATVHNCFITDADNIMLLLYYAVLGIANVAMYASMVYCTKATFSMLWLSRPDMQPKTIKLQRQMNMLLLVQLLTPTVFAALPLTMAVISCSMRFTFCGLALVVLYCFVWIPLINPLITIVLVSNYRRKFVRILCLPLRLASRRRHGVVASTTHGIDTYDSSTHAVHK